MVFIDEINTLRTATGRVERPQYRGSSRALKPKENEMSIMRIAGFVICSFLALISIVSLFQGGSSGAHIVAGFFAALFALGAFLCARPR